MNLEAKVLFGSKIYMRLENLDFLKLKKMKKLILFLLLISSASIAQESFSWGFKEGISLSQVSENRYKGFNKTGFTGGAFIKFRLSDNLNIGTEAVYTECGDIKRAKYKKKHFNNYFLQLNYVQIPLLLHCHIQAYGIEVGPGYAFLLNAKEIDVVDGIAYSGTNVFNKNDVYFNVGLNYALSSRFGLNLRYINSINPVRTLIDNTDRNLKYEQKNNMFILFLTYEFGGEDPSW